MTQFILFVTSAPSTQAAHSAYKFAQTLVEQTPDMQTHQLKAVFFYGDAVKVANQLKTPPSDEFNLTQAWQTLATQSKTPLIICSAAAQRRGILDAEEAEYHGHNTHNLASQFRIGGLAEYVTLQTQCDKVVQF